jgi:hypothetical protein
VYLAGGRQRFGPRFFRVIPEVRDDRHLVERAVYVRCCPCVDGLAEYLERPLVDVLYRMMHGVGIVEGSCMRGGRPSEKFYTYTDDSPKWDTGTERASPCHMR